MSLSRHTRRSIGWQVLGSGQDAWRTICNVFEFRDNLIVRVHVYLDPDYVSEANRDFAGAARGGPGNAEEQAQLEREPWTDVRTYHISRTANGWTPRVAQLRRHRAI